jgi:hypothetical protein
VFHHLEMATTHVAAIDSQQEWSRQPGEGCRVAVLEESAVPAMGGVPNRIIALWLRVLRVLDWNVAVAVDA